MSEMFFFVLRRETLDFDPDKKNHDLGPWLYLSYLLRNKFASPRVVEKRSFLVASILEFRAFWDASHVCPVPSLQLIHLNLLGL